ncbi:MATE family efflux transporter [Hahella sp. HN01]|uniref:MATE family efflux transporter n=1 Tax=Hahella sp. HN01 TaxID=2847262 RepID=UPI001C1EB269|nr:MATE family efflux transporter [Hahella sp. HN01]MBU6953407.1 hypothetical protein [Hahella sp. HN01]
MTMAVVKAEVEYCFKELIASLTIAYPILISLSLSMIAGLTDMIVLGRFSTVSLSAAVVGNSVFIIFATAINGLIRGMVPLYFQSEDAAGKHRVIRSGAQLALFSGVVGCLLLQLHGVALTFLNLPADIAFAASRYLDVLALGLVPLSLSMLVTNLFVVTKNTKPLLKISALSFAMNALSTVALVYGWLGFTPMGEQGAAIGTVIGYVFALAFGYRLCGAGLFNFQAGKDPLRVERKMLRRIIRIGAPISASVIAKFAAMSVLAMIAAYSGADSAAAFGILNSIASIAFIFAIAYGQAQMSRVGAVIDVQAEPRRWFIAFLFNGVVVMSSLIAVVYLISDKLVYFYTPDRRVAELALEIVPLMLLACLFDGVQASAGIVLTAFKDTFFSFVSLLISYFVLCIPMVLVWGNVQGEGIVFDLFFSMTVGLFVLCILQVARLHYVATYGRNTLIANRPKQSRAA